MTEPYSRCPPVERDDVILIHVTTICAEPIAGPAAAAAASLLSLSHSVNARCNGLMDDVIFAHKSRLLDVAAQLKRSAHAALSLAMNWSMGVCSRPTQPQLPQQKKDPNASNSRVAECRRQKVYTKTPCHFRSSEQHAFGV